MSIKNVIELKCDRCKNSSYLDADKESYDEEIPNWTTFRRVGENAPDIHMCSGCLVDFVLFMENKAVRPAMFGRDLFPKDFDFENGVTNG